MMLARKLFSWSAVLCALSLIACDDDTAAPNKHQLTFNNLGLQGKTVHELDLVGNQLWASTDAGLFVKDLSANDEDWEAMGLAEKNVKTFITLENNLYLASTTNPTQEEFQLHKSTDGGQSWQVADTDWGGEFSEPLNDLAWDEENEVLYGVGLGVVAKSENRGENWTVLQGEWGAMATGLAFVALNPQNGDIWAGGQNAIEGFTLHRQNSENGQWQSWQNLLPAPSVGKAIAFSSTEPQAILVGSEDGIVKTTNHGTSWTTVKHDHLSKARFYFGLDFDHQLENRLYAASWDKDFDNPQPILLHISDDGGSSWQEYTYNTNGLFGGAWSMVQKSDGNRTRLYLGLFKGGVYEVVVEDVTSTE